MHREIVNARVFHAPRETVFAAFERPEQLARWWGPQGFKNTFHQFDLRPGGAWRLVMHGPDGTNYEMTKEFLEVVKPEKIVLRHHGPMHRFSLTMTYEEAGPGETRLTWRMVFDVPETDAMKKIISDANEQNFDRLAARLASGP